MLPRGLVGLRRLVVEGMAGGEALPPIEALVLEPMPRLRELELLDNPGLARVDGLEALTGLTSLRILACPLLPRSEPAMAALERLTALRSLSVTGSATLHRLPRSVTALTGLTSLEIGATMRDRGDDGPLPQDFAPLGRGGEENGQGLLRAWGLRRLVVRDFQGRLHLPEGMERFTALEELDLGGRQELWNLGPWLLRLRALRRVVVPRRAAAQSLFEALSLRNDPHQVEVVEEDADHEGAPPSDDDGDWGGDAEDWAGEGF